MRYVTIFSLQLLKSRDNKMADAPEEPREEPSFEPSSKENSSTNSSDAAIEIIVKPNEQPSPKLFLNNTKEVKNLNILLIFCIVYTNSIRVFGNQSERPG